jgi:hypothetical protein
MSAIAPADSSTIYNTLYERARLHELNRGPTVPGVEHILQLTGMSGVPAPPGSVMSCRGGGSSAGAAGAGQIPQHADDRRVGLFASSGRLRARL